MDFQALEGAWQSFPASTLIKTSSQHHGVADKASLSSLRDAQETRVYLWRAKPELIAGCAFPYKGRGFLSSWYQGSLTTRIHDRLKKV